MVHPGDLLTQRSHLRLLSTAALAGGSFTTRATWEALFFFPPGGREKWFRNPAGLSSCSGGLRPLVELCVEPWVPRLSEAPREVP